MSEELDLDVEPLAATTGFDVSAGAETPALPDPASALRLAAAVPAAHRAGRPAAIVRAAAALAGVGALAWGTYWLYAPLQRSGRTDSLAALQARPSSPEAPGAQRPQLPPSSGTSSSSPPWLPPSGGRSTAAAEPEAPRAPGPAGRPPTSRQDVRRPARRPANPLKEPLPAVNSILVSADRRIAVLDGRIVEEGDAVGPRVLLRIEPEAVILREPSGYAVRVPVRRGPAVGGPPPAFRGRARNFPGRFRAFDV